MLWLAMFVSSNIYLASYASLDKIESSYLYDFGDQESDQEENKNEETEDHKIGNEVHLLQAMDLTNALSTFSMTTYNTIKHVEIVTPPPENLYFTWIF